MTDPEIWLAATMLRLGRVALVPSSEAASGSVWVDDPIKVATPGYYEKRQISLPYQVHRDGKVAAVDLQYEATWYRIQCGSLATYDANLARAVDVIDTILSWIDIGIVTWQQGFAGFVRDIGDPVWWRVLRLPPDATRAEIEAAYRRLASIHHPDAGGSHEAFLRLRRAYEAALNAAA